MTPKPLPHELSGNKNSKAILVFMHGYPDTPALWDKIIAPLEQDYYILNLDYPNFSQKENISWGIDFDDLLERAKATVDAVNDTNRRIVVVSHDWGAMFSYWFDQKYPNYVSEIISLDVGGAQDQTAWKIFYQLWLALAFVIGGFIGNIMTSIMLSTFHYTPPWNNRINTTWNWPYYYVWKRVLAGIFKGKKDQIPLKPIRPSCPVVFVYGTNKPYMFHNKRWIDKVTGDGKGEVHAVASGHWIPVEQPQFVTDLVKRRVGQLVKSL